jgi:hypothetical protein
MPSATRETPDPERPPAEPPTLIDEYLYLWRRKGENCPRCGSHISWKHDGTLWHGTCGCEFSHSSTEQRTWG